MTDWGFKIFAYLHDPPDKPLALGRPGGHAAWGRELAKKLGAEPSTEERHRWEALVSRADRLAAGADRSALLPQQEVAVDELRHPLSGRAIDLRQARLDLRREELRVAAERALREELDELARRTDGDSQAAFLALWALLPARLRARRGPHELQGAWDLLPAETRMPNHPVSAHAALVSALVTILAVEEMAALLSFAVGPVQRFIAQARRTSDLWAGSVVLGQAILAGVRPIVEELGPDHVVFPVLRSNRAFLGWLVKRSPWAARLGSLWPDGEIPDHERLGSLPNRFLAVVPASRAEDLGKRCERAVQECWGRFVAERAMWLQEAAQELGDYAAMTTEQAGGHLRVTWAASPWPLVDAVSDERAEAICLAAWGRGARLGENVERYIGIIREARANPGGGPKPFQPNGGILYAGCYDSVERLAAAVKLTPRLTPRPEGGLKCSLCGERSVVPARIEFESQRALWRGLQRRLEAGDETRGLVRNGEALCGVCWAKRRFGFEEHLTGIPSTPEIAATPFKAALLRKLDSADTPGEFREAMDDLCRKVEQDGRYWDAFVVPGLRRFKRTGGLAGRVARVSGEVLLAHPREDRDPDAEPVPPEIARAAARLRSEAAEQGIARPRPYLAVIVVDGDEMGKWLSGEKSVLLGEYLSERARNELEGQFREWNIESLLGLPWPMTPALHVAFSEACGVFSQRTAPRTVEEESLGVLVYAGGDDVLALVPVGMDVEGKVEYATEMVRQLRFRFSGHVRRQEKSGEDVVATTETEAGFVLDRYGLGLAFGGLATASAGVAVFHNRWPLSRALDAARQAEKYAKNVLRRDALGITILRRSGQATVTGLGFRERGGQLPDLLELALPIMRGAAERHAEGAPQEEREAVCMAIEVLARAGAAKSKCSSCDAPLGSTPTCIECQAALRMSDATDPVRAFQDLCRAFSPAGQLSPRLVSEVGQRLDQLAEDPRGEGEHLRRWLRLIEVAAFLGRGGQE
jgi:CRISPR-associated protein Cmr2